MGTSLVKGTTNDASTGVDMYSADHTVASGNVPSSAKQEFCIGRVPAWVHQCLEDFELHQRPVMLSIDTDVSLDGQPLQEWLSVTADHLVVVGGPEPSKVLRIVLWKSVSLVRTSAGVGGGTLQVKADGEWIDLIRFSNAMSARFHKISRALENVRENPENLSGLPMPQSDPSLFEQLEGVIDPPRCSSCSLRLSSREEFCPRCMQKGQILRRVVELLAPYRRGAVLLCVLTCVGVAAELIPPKLQQYMVDDILSGQISGSENTPGSLAPLPDFKTALLVVVVALAFSRVLLSIVGVFKGRLATAIGTGLTGTLREEMVQKLQNLSIAYYDRHQVSSMISRVAHDSEVLHGLMHQLTGGFLLQLVQLVGVGAMLVWINPKLAMFTLIPVPLVFLGSWIFWRHVYPRHYRLWDASSKQMSVLSGMLSGIRIVKAFSQEPRELNRFHQSSDHLRHWRQWVEHTNSTYSAAMQLVFGLGGLIVWYVGGRDVIGSQMTLGQLIAFLAYLAMFYAPLGALSNFTTWLTSFLSGSKRVLELLDTPIVISDPAAPQEWKDPVGSIRFSNVTFGYDRNQPVLRDVSFDVKPGEMIGVVGRSGSGKTTLVNLLGRFYDVQEGSITVDGIDIRNLATQQLRERLGIVFQDSFLFRGTIWKNLSYGRPAATIEEGLEAAKAAGAHDFLCRQCLAYETLLGEHGAGLSGGEKQRLSIARTLLYDPKILVLDEATSNIDAEAEKNIQDALAVLVRGRTTIAIAHRLSTLRNADRILVFDSGRLVETGTHAELLTSDGIYARLVRLQTQVSKRSTIDTLLVDPVALSTKETLTAPAPSSIEGGSESNPTHAVEGIHWLSPTSHRFVIGVNDRIELWSEQEPVAAGIFLVRTFPASYASEYLSVRGWNESGDEIEVGMIRSLKEWHDNDQSVVMTALRRRSLIRSIQRVHEVRLSHGYLDFLVETDVGRQKFTTRWTQSQVLDFGADGKMLIDTEENRYLIPSIEAMPKVDQDRFLQYVYW